MLQLDCLLRQAGAKMCPVQLDASIEAEGIISSSGGTLQSVLVRPACSARSQHMLVRAAQASVAFRPAGSSTTHACHWWPELACAAAQAPVDHNAQAFSRTPAQVLKLLTQGSTTGTGGFLPKGLNGEPAAAPRVSITAALAAGEVSEPHG